MKYTIYLYMLCSFIFFSLNVSAQTRQTLSLNTHFEPPISTKERDGFIDLVLIEAFERSDVDIKIRFVPALRGATLANSGADDGHFTRTAKAAKAFENLLPMNVPLHQSEYIAMVKRDDISIDKWEDLQRYHVGYPFGWDVFESQKTHFGEGTPYYKIPQMIEHLATDKIDVMLGGRIETKILKNRYKLPSYREIEPPLVKKEIFLLLHKKHRNLISKLDLALSDMISEGVAQKLCPPCKF